MSLDRHLCFAPYSASLAMTRYYTGTLMPLLKRMQSAGSLTRECAEFDERRVVVSMTTAGEALRARGRTVPQQIGATTGLTANDALALISQLPALRERLRAAPSLRFALLPDSSPAAARRVVAPSTTHH